MSIPDLSAKLPSPHDEEPAQLRSDILDELQDHLSCAVDRERRRLQLSNQPVDAVTIWQSVIERFGDPSALARRLWFDAMKGRLMTQRVLLGAVAVAVIALIGWMFVLSQSLTAVIDENQRATAKVLELLEKEGAGSSSNVPPALLGQFGESQTPEVPRPIPTGMRVATVQVGDTLHTHVASLVRPGDKVDVFVRGVDGPEALLEFVEVYAVENTTPGKGSKRQGIQHVSLLVTPEMMKAVLIAQDTKFLSLSPRSPQDVATLKLNVAVLEQLMNPEQFHAAMLAKLQGVWEAEWSYPGTTADGKEYARVPETSTAVIEIRNDKLMVRSSSDPSVDKDKETAYFKLRSIQRDQSGNPLQVDLDMWSFNSPESAEEGMPGIIEIKEDQVRICFNETTRPTAFAVGPAHATWMWTLKRSVAQRDGPG